MCQASGQGCPLIGLIGLIDVSGLRVLHGIRGIPHVDVRYHRCKLETGTYTPFVLLPLSPVPCLEMSAFQTKRFINMQY